MPPTNWTRVTLPSGLGSLSVPPRLRAIHGDPGTATFAYLGSGGTYLAYLNVTPLQGDEGLAGWAGFRLDHLRDDDAISAREDGAVQSVRTGQSLRSCVTDDYVTKIGQHHFHEVACFVMSHIHGQRRGGRDSFGGPSARLDATGTRRGPPTRLRHPGWLSRLNEGQQVGVDRRRFCGRHAVREAAVGLQGSVLDKLGRQWARVRIGDDLIVIAVHHEHRDRDLLQSPR